MAHRVGLEPTSILVRSEVPIQIDYRCKNLAGVTGFEPATYDVTGRYANQLHLTPFKKLHVQYLGLEEL